MEAEPVMAASVARGARGVVCEEALAAAFEGGGRKARSVIGDLDDEAPARDVAGDRHARACVQIILSVVDLPAPLGPSSPYTSPSRI